jgi:hypothetical protein
MVYEPLPLVARKFLHRFYELRVFGFTDRLHTNCVIAVWVLYRNRCVSEVFRQHLRSKENGFCQISR